jgi:hypothetical protein
MSETTTAARRGLLIGIDEYLYPEIPPLEGCVNDAELMANILEHRFGFPAANLTVLRDEARRGRRSWPSWIGSWTAPAKATSSWSTTAGTARR